jgi:hypothetical protein
MSSNIPRNRTKRKPEEMKRWNHSTKFDERGDRKLLRGKREDGCVEKLVLEETHKPLHDYRRRAVKELLPLLREHCYQHNSSQNIKINPGNVAYRL